MLSNVGKISLTADGLTPGGAGEVSLEAVCRLGDGSPFLRTHTRVGLRAVRAIREMPRESDGRLTAVHFRLRDDDVKWP